MKSIFRILFLVGVLHQITSTQRLRVYNISAKAIESKDDTSMYNSRQERPCDLTECQSYCQENQKTEGRCEDIDCICTVFDNSTLMDNNVPLVLPGDHETFDNSSGVVNTTEANFEPGLNNNDANSGKNNNSSLANNLASNSSDGLSNANSQTETNITLTDAAIGIHESPANSSNDTTNDIGTYNNAKINLTNVMQGNSNNINSLHDSNNLTLTDNSNMTSFIDTNSPNVTVIDDVKMTALNTTNIIEQNNNQDNDNMHSDQDMDPPKKKHHKKHKHKKHHHKKGKGGRHKKDRSYS